MKKKKEEIVDEIKFYVLFIITILLIALDLTFLIIALN